MFVEFYGIRPFAVLLAALTSFSVNWVWYSFIGQYWMRLQGLVHPNFNKYNDVYSYIVFFVISLIQFTVLEWLIGILEIRNPLSSTAFSVLLSFSFLTLEDFSRNLWDKETKPLTVLIIDAGNTMLGFAAGGFALGFIH
ncbi:hypothetical protein CH373_10645 [Leptospira perolatii]|uniref:DUF1761 domain-containing protein n=1 Tax=Leptospira perolatii TaxID=2023191 RepID=A0A2M9ZLK0_9LEPT|nr:DUF1761 domain-containing protein [Leptospira perolatii]PJZ69823.1 hypothetical protein CH360_09590 [Leptospira perolatii]PJZ72962.1 hypothetical protein CH373_10645 [Leptospira perolatii]